MGRCRFRALVAVALFVSIGLGTAGAITAAGAATSSKSSTSGKTVDPWTWPGNAKEGYLAPHEPLVHGGTKVKVGLITAGTIHDHGYYQSAVTALQQYAKKYHWSTIIQGSVATANAVSDAEDMCSQGVDLMVVSALDAADAAAGSSACKGTPFWVSGAVGTQTPTPYAFLALTTADPESYVTGVAMGLWLKAHHETTAGFITGPALSFTERPAQAYLAGMRAVIPNASLDSVFTGSLTASGPAVTAAQSMITKGIKLIFPYLGGSLFTVAKFVTQHGGATISDGGNWCDHQGVTFAVRQVYNPGYFLPPQLIEFEKGKFRVGVTEVHQLGVTKFPAVSLCSSSGVKGGTVKLRAVIKQLAKGQLTATAIINKIPAPS